MDNSAWKLNDSEWLEKRKKQWPYFREKIEYSYMDDQDSLEKALEEYRGYFTGVSVEMPSKEEGWTTRGDHSLRILMHPDPSVDNIRCILNHYKEQGHSNRLSNVLYHLPDMALSGRELISAGVVDISVVENYMDVIYGNDIDEMLEIHGIDFSEDGDKLISKICTRISRWVSMDVMYEDDVTLIDRWLHLLDGALSKASNENIDKAKFRVAKIFRLMRIFEEGSYSAEVPKSIELMGKLRKQTLAGYSSYCSRLQEYCDELREVLEAENKL